MVRNPRESGIGSPPPFRSILLGLDLSEQAERVARVASLLAKVFGSKVQAVVVVTVPTSSAGNEMDGTPANQDEIKLRDELLHLIHDEFGDQGEAIDVKVLHGDPGQRIAEYAAYLKCDLIIVGSRGQGMLRKTFFGSVSESVANKSKTSVLIVR